MHPFSVSGLKRIEMRQKADFEISFKAILLKYVLNKRAEIFPKV